MDQDGQVGNEVIDGTEAPDNLYGDAVTVGEGEATTGDDTLSGYGGDDTLFGDAQEVQAGGSSSGNDALFGGGGNDWLYGDAQSVDTTATATGDDSLHGEDGDDNLFGGNGADYLSGDNGNDALFGGNDDDILAGGAGQDMLWGEAGSDLLQGDGGDDQLVGGAGADTLAGGAGNDILLGDEFSIPPSDSAVALTAPAGDLFVFNLTLTRGCTEFFTEWDLTNHPDDPPLTTPELRARYVTWLETLVAQYADDGLGKDVKGDGVISVDLKSAAKNGLPTIEGLSARQVDALFDETHVLTEAAGRKTVSQYYANKFTIDAPALGSGDGHDTIVDFNTSSTEDGDRLVFIVNDAASLGLTAAQVLALMEVTAGDWDGDGYEDDTRVAAAQGDAGWSVTLVDVLGIDLADVSIVQSSGPF